MGESLVIIALIGILAFMAVRAGRGLLAVLSLPLCSVSLGHLLSVLFHQPLLEVGLTAQAALWWFCIGGLVLGLGLSLVLARGVQLPRMRWVYLAFSAVFQCALATAYLLRP